MLNTSCDDIPLHESLKESSPDMPTAFIGHARVYILGAADVPLSQTVYANPDITGAAVRTKWEKLESAEGIFNWDFLDGEIAKAKQAGKKISITVLGNPPWLKALGVRYYEYIDRNVYHDTYLDTLADYVPWDDLYIERLKILIHQLASRYANEAAVSYVNMVAVQMSRNLPDSTVSGKFYEQFDYDPDYLVARMKEVLDYYMVKFPATPLWSSMDYITFEPEASGNARNYVASAYSQYGIGQYPDRFGLWREDLSGCNPDIENLQPTAHWYMLKQNPCRTGAQMLWHVQDGPDRMNKCNIVPDSKEAVLSAAVEKGLTLGMRYLEIYAADVNDTSLGAVCRQANDALISESQDCDTL